ncbi:MAG: flagellar export chaperone FliS [Chitinispirillales bacterium]|jgi:flagellar protein FliS|nr:flagellar export chaperone FliS [Chitinispirillales bacterium]
MKMGYGAYKSTQAETTDQGKLILVTYDVAIKHAKLAVEKFGDQKAIEERVKHIFKVQDALEELQQSLNMEAGGEIAMNLYNLYGYMFRTTVDANITNDKSGVEEVITHLEALRDAWAQATMKAKAETTPDLNFDNMAISG